MSDLANVHRLALDASEIAQKAVDALRHDLRWARSLDSLITLGGNAQAEFQKAMVVLSRMEFEVTELMMAAAKTEQAPEEQR